MNAAGFKAGDDDAFALLRGVLLHPPGGVNAPLMRAIDARDLLLRSRAQITDVFLVERTNILAPNLLDEQAMPVCIRHVLHPRVARRGTGAIPAFEKAWHLSVFARSTATGLTSQM